MTDERLEALLREGIGEREEVPGAALAGARYALERGGARPEIPEVRLLPLLCAALAVMELACVALLAPWAATLPRIVLLGAIAVQGAGLLGGSAAAWAATMPKRNIFETEVLSWRWR